MKTNDENTVSQALTILRKWLIGKTFSALAVSEPGSKVTLTFVSTEEEFPASWIHLKIWQGWSVKDLQRSSKILSELDTNLRDEIDQFPDDTTHLSDFVRLLSIIGAYQVKAVDLFPSGDLSVTLDDRLVILAPSVTEETSVRNFDSWNVEFDKVAGEVSLGKIFCPAVFTDDEGSLVIRK